MKALVGAILGPRHSKGSQPQTGPLPKLLPQSDRQGFHRPVRDVAVDVAVFVAVVTPLPHVASWETSTGYFHRTLNHH